MWYFVDTFNLNEFHRYFFCPLLMTGRLSCLLFLTPLASSSKVSLSSVLSSASFLTRCVVVLSSVCTWLLMDLHSLCMHYRFKLIFFFIYIHNIFLAYSDWLIPNQMLFYTCLQSVTVLGGWIFSEYWQQMTFIVNVNTYFICFVLFFFFFLLFWKSSLQIQVTV